LARSLAVPPLAEGRLGGVIHKKRKITPSSSPSARGRNRGATVIALQGDLGTGKTTFTQGFLEALGIKRRVPSPTFVIMKRYKLKHPYFTNAHHMDAYRLRKPEDVSQLGFEKILADPKNIVLVEWPENIKGALPRGTRKVIFKYGEKENERVVTI
jgi:tRNA threonylcarbamoyladenosine biosynthesis protein TsaE